MSSDSVTDTEDHHLQKLARDRPSEEKDITVLNAHCCRVLLPTTELKLYKM